MTLKARIAAGDTLFGSFLKSPSPILVEVLATAALDLLCLDAEHAPFASAQRTVVIAQIEDAEALDVLGDIMSLEGIDAFFVGRIDLTVSLNAASPDDAVVIDAVDRIKASVLAKIKLGRLGNVEDPMGASLFLASDASAMMTGTSLVIDGGGTAE